MQIRIKREAIVTTKGNSKYSQLVVKIRMGIGMPHPPGMNAEVSRVEDEEYKFNRLCFRFGIK